MGGSLGSEWRTDRRDRRALDPTAGPSGGRGAPGSVGTRGRPATIPLRAPSGTDPLANPAASAAGRGGRAVPFRYRTTDDPGRDRRGDPPEPGGVRFLPGPVRRRALRPSPPVVLPSLGRRSMEPARRPRRVRGERRRPVRALRGVRFRDPRIPGTFARGPRPHPVGRPCRVGVRRPARHESRPVVSRGPVPANRTPGDSRGGSWEPRAARAYRRLAGPGRCGIRPGGLRAVRGVGEARPGDAGGGSDRTRSNGPGPSPGRAASPARSPPAGWRSVPPRHRARLDVGPGRGDAPTDR